MNISIKTNKEIKILFVSLLLLGLCVLISRYPLPENNEAQQQETRSPMDLDLHSAAYLIGCIDSGEVVFSFNADRALYPASLSKIATMDAVLHLCPDLQQTSSISYSQIRDLIRQDAALAGLQADKGYSIEDLLYALTLPSGADAAIALENWFRKQDMDLVEQINIRAGELGCRDSFFTNTTGLHDDEHRMSLDDLFLFIRDVMRFDCGRQIMTSLFHRMADELDLISTVKALGYSGKVDILGGKSGYTEESGQSIVVIYRFDGSTYALILANAFGDPGEGEFWHREDARRIFEYLY